MNNSPVPTLAQVIAQLNAFAKANPDALNAPLGMTLDRGEALDRGAGSIWFVRDVRADEGGAALLTRGV